MSLVEHHEDLYEESVGVEDVLYANYKELASSLPAGWPRVSQLNEHHCLDFSTAIHPVANKAREHLQLLQLSLMHWYQPVQRPSSPAAPVTQPTRKTPFHPESVLKIEGVGQSNETRRQSSPGSELLHLGASDVIQEVITLLARLELDRQTTIEQLNSEKSRVAELGNRIDRLALARAITFPAIIQKEHEACGKDLGELKWHVMYRSRTEARVQSLLNNAKLLNSQLHEEVERVKEHTPLMEEKLHLEMEAMKKIEDAQHETDAELQLTLARCGEVQKRSDDAVSRAVEERNAMKKDLDNYRGQLQRAIEQLSAAKSLYNDYISKHGEYRRNIRKLNVDLPIETARNENSSVKHLRQTNKVNALTEKLHRVQVTFSELEDDYAQLNVDAAHQRKEMNSELTELEQTILIRQQKLHEMTQMNKELTFQNENTDWKCKDLDHQHDAAIKTVERLHRDIDRTNNQLAVVLEDLTNVEIIHDSKQRELIRQQDTCFTDESTIKTLAETLRKNIKDEMQRKIILRAKIDKTTSEAEQADVYAKDQETIFLKKEVEVKKAVAEIRSKVDALDSSYKTNSQTLLHLENNLSTTQNHVTTVRSTCHSKLTDLRPMHSTIKDELDRLTVKLNNINEDTDMMKRGLEDMDSSSVMINRASHSTQQELDQLQSELDELHQQCTAVQTLKDNIVSSLNVVEERDCDHEAKHTNVVSERSHILEQHSAELLASKEANRKLASRYRRLQNSVIDKKTDLLKSYRERTRLENDVKDARQLVTVQQRVHVALQLYYKYRGMYTVSELTRMQSESKNSAQHLGELQQRIDQTLAAMSTFVRSQLESSDANDKARDECDVTVTMTTNIVTQELSA